MADLKIKRYEDWTNRLTITIDNVAMDSSLYTFVCKIRDRRNNTGTTYIEPDPTTATTAVVGGQPSKLDISFTSEQTRKFAATRGIPDSALPLLDVELTTISDSSVTYTDSLTVEILDTQSHA